MLIIIIVKVFFLYIYSLYIDSWLYMKQIFL